MSSDGDPLRDMHPLFDLPAHPAHHLPGSARSARSRA